MVSGRPSLVWHLDTCSYRYSSEIHGLVAMVSMALGYPNLPVEVKFWRDTGRKMGQADLEKRVIWLSVDWFECLCPWYRRQVIIHEVCHIIAWLRSGDDGHGSDWKACARHVGAIPSATVKVLSYPVREAV